MLIRRGFSFFITKEVVENKKYSTLAPENPITVSTGIVMKVIPDNELWGKEVLTLTPPATRFFWDHGPISYFCGKCKIVLAEAVGKMEGSNKVLKCNNCGSYNAFANR